MSDQLELNKTRGRLLQLLRQQAKLEQQEVADVLEVNRVTVSRWETGAAALKRSTARELVMLYMARGVTPDADAMAAAGLEIPKRTADRPLGTSPSRSTDRRIQRQ